MHTIPNQTTIGLRWATLIMTFTPVSVVCSVYLFNTIHPIITGFWILLNCWLFTGLFITAHDCMHNSVCPTNTKLNRTVGQGALLLYAGLKYAKLLEGHILHHSDTATDVDPDYHPQNTTSQIALAIKWYLSFLKSYLTWHPFAWMSFWFTLFDRGFGVPIEAMWCCWIAPQVLSTIQLFYFGTYLPHRGTFENNSFPARSNNYPKWLSMLTCFHFGYHFEHHEHPYVPWWYLPTIRTQSRKI